MSASWIFYHFCQVLTPSWVIFANTHVLPDAWHVMTCCDQLWLNCCVSFHRLLAAVTRALLMRLGLRWRPGSPGCCMKYPGYDFSHLRISCFHFSSFFNACKKLQVTDWAFSTFSFISFCIRFIFIVFFLTWEAAFVRQGTHSLRRRARSCVMWFQGSGRRKPTFSILSRQKPSTRRWLQLFPLIWSIL